MSRASGFLKVIAFNLAFVIAGLIVIELFFGTWFSSTHALHQFIKPRNVVLTAKNPFPTGRPEIRYTRDKYGLRGLDSPIDKIDILTIGGSTTDQRWIDDAETYQAVMKAQAAKNNKKLSIVNAGIDGQSTIGHIHSFSSWLDKIENLKTRYILFYVGINDIAISDADPHDAMTNISQAMKFQLWLREKSALYQLYLVTKHILFPGHWTHTPTKRNLAIGNELTDKARLTSYELPIFVANIEALKKRIERLSELTRAMGAEPIFVTQRSGRWTKRGGRLLGVDTYQQDLHGGLFKLFGPITGVDIHNLERKVADIILSECEKARGVCINLMAEIEFEIERDFYDPVHTTPAGSRVIGEYIYDKLKDRL